ncbi:hypothetical protein J43TS3_09850 [Ornithinibacillus bavariensis]|uniref:Uncharacterized protein n=1 Tax=Ornithinibacillus bavariensis TaxID=545502 RepID=A0A919X602_9BACI|nr:hypothetical protein J43TS3_09850 [Ornithinibacillus bavariensis]
MQIRAKENENSVVEPIDLIDHKLQTFIEFDFRTDRQLNLITAFYKMVKRYDIENGGFKNKVLRA